MFGLLKSTLALGISAVTLALTASTTKAATFELEEATIAEINQAFDSGALTSEQLVQLYLNRIEAYEDSGPLLNSILTVNPKALEVAAELDQERQAQGPRSPLHGVPVLLKDNIDTFDLPTTNGSVILKDSIPPDDAYITESLRDAGAVILGKAALGEFAGAPYNTVQGQAKNPYNFIRETGGSSSGSAAAVAANLTTIAFGTDTSTSVRGPSSYTGIVGFRPTIGLISRDGIIPKALTFDTAGPMTRTVADTAIALNAVAGVDPADPRTLASEGRVEEDYTQFLQRGSLQGARLGIARDFFGGDPEIERLAEDVIATLRELGAEIVGPVTFDPQFLDFFVVNGGENIRTPINYEFKPDFEAYLATLGPNVPKTVAEFVEIYKTEVNNSPLPVADSVLDLLETALVNFGKDDPVYLNAKENLLPRATQTTLNIFDTYNLDALVYPYQTNFAPPISNPVFTAEDPTFVPSDRPRPATLAGYNSVGFPDITVPMGFGSGGLPMTISFYGRPYSEGKLISYAYDYEQATQLRQPSPLVPPLSGEVIEYETVPEPVTITGLAITGLGVLRMKLIRNRRREKLL